MRLKYSKSFPNRTLFHYKLLSSTNDKAYELVVSDTPPPAGSVVSADAQSHGKGQGTNRWLSNPGENLLFSVILYPGFLDPARLFDLNIITSLAITEALAQAGVRNLKIKWPNDILSNEKKISGILIRNLLAGKNISASITGIGINVNQTGFPPSLPNATSVKKETGRAYERNQLLNDLLDSLEENYIALENGAYPALKKKYIERLYRFEEKANYQDSEGKVFSGYIADVAEDGRLIIVQNDRRRPFAMREIKFL